MPLLVQRKDITVSKPAEKHYAEALRKLSTHYYDGKTWRPNRQSNGDTHLVEFWEKQGGQGGIEHHESRNPFNWVQDDKVKLGWHSKLKESIQLVRGGLARQLATHPYPLDIPPTLTAASLIGYTSKNPTPPVTMNFTLEYQPSVYYLEGHYTRDHTETDNLGWKDKSTGWTCLCFANVPVEYLEGNYVPGQPVLVNPGGLQEQGWMFLAGDVKAQIVKQTRDQPPTYLVKLDTATGPHYRITQVEVPDEYYSVPGHQRHHRIHAN